MRALLIILLFISISNLIHAQHIEVDLDKLITLMECQSPDEFETKTKALGYSYSATDTVDSRAWHYYTRQVTIEGVQFLEVISCMQFASGRTWELGFMSSAFINPNYLTQLEKALKGRSFEKAAIPDAEGLITYVSTDYRLNIDDRAKTSRAKQFFVYMKYLH